MRRRRSLTIAEAARAIEAVPALGHSYPRPYPAMARWGFLWIKMHRYWFGWSTNRGYPVVTNILYDQSRMERRVAHMIASSSERRDQAESGLKASLGVVWSIKGEKWSGNPEHDHGLMKRSQRWLIVASLFLLAIASATYSLDYRVSYFYRVQGHLIDRVGTDAPAPVINFGEQNSAFSSDESSDALSRLLAQSRVTVSALFPRRGMTFDEGLIGGLLTPILLVVGGCFLALGGSPIRARNNARASVAIEAPPSAATSNESHRIRPQQVATAASMGGDSAAVMKSAVAAAVFFPVLFVLDMPSMMLMSRLKFPRWLFWLYVLYGFRSLGIASG
jgi:hypothetical protein